MFKQTYFEPGGQLNPLSALERLLHPYTHRSTLQLDFSNNQWQGEFEL